MCKSYVLKHPLISATYSIQFSPLADPTVPATVLAALQFLRVVVVHFLPEEEAALITLVLGLTVPSTTIHATTPMRKSYSQNSIYNPSF